MRDDRPSALAISAPSADVVGETVALDEVDAALDGIRAGQGR